jgi:hypothetical protein
MKRRAQAYSQSGMSVLMSSKMRSFVSMPSSVVVLEIKSRNDPRSKEATWSEKSPVVMFSMCRLRIRFGCEASYTFQDGCRKMQVMTEEAATRKRIIRIRARSPYLWAKGRAIGRVRKPTTETIEAIILSAGAAAPSLPVRGTKMSTKVKIPSTPKTVGIICVNPSIFVPCLRKREARRNAIPDR